MGKEKWGFETYRDIHKNTLGPMSNYGGLRDATPRVAFSAVANRSIKTAFGNENYMKFVLSTLNTQ